MVKKSMKKLFVALAAFSAVNSLSASVNTTSHNYLQARAFSANLAREMMMEGSKHRDDNGWYGEFSATAAFQRTWESTGTNDDVNAEFGLGTYPFWSGTNSMTVGTNSSESNLDAYQFGLGDLSDGETTLVPGSITLNPIVYQAGGDLMFVIGSSANEPCFFAKVKAPIGVYNINPNLTEVAANIPFNAYPAGSIASNLTATAVGTIVPNTVATYQPAETMAQAFAGKLPGGQLAQGDFKPMQYGLIDGVQSTGAKFGDMELTAGYRFISNDDNSFSVAVRAAAPTGGRAEGVYVLEPVFGRGGNWALGGYLDGHVTFWNGSNDNCFMMKFMANAMHLFNAKTVRSYDLTANGDGSKYLLVANYEGGIYQGEIANLINYSTLDSLSKFGVEGDATLALTYMGRNWSIDLGYEFWGRSSETLTIVGDFAEQSYGILGRQGVANTTGFASASGALLQPTATIAASEARAANDAPATATLVLATTAANRIALADLNVEGAAQATALTSKVYTKVTYEFCESDNKPHVGVMGEFEFSTSQNNALPQWGVSLIGGLSF